MGRPRLKRRHQARGLKFRQLADDLALLIAQDVLRPGARVPSVRELRDARGLAVGTICRALEDLEARGLVEARPRSGYFVRARSPQKVPPTINRPLTARSVPDSIVADRFLSSSMDDTRVRFVASTADRDLIALGGTVLGEDLVPVRQLQRTAREVFSSVPNIVARYASPLGLQELRRQIVRLLVERGVSATAEDVVTTVGCLNAMRLAVGTVARPGETVVVESPAFFAVLPMLRDLGMRVVQVPVDSRTGLDLERLDRALRESRAVALLTTPSFQNPTGAVADLAGRRALLALAASHGIAIIEDDVYSDLYRDQPPPPPLAALASRDVDVMLCSSFSKTLAAGLRVGFVWSPRHAEALVRRKTESFMTAPVVGEHVISDYLATGAYSRHLRRVRGAIRSQVDAFASSVLRHFGDDVAVMVPQGGYVLWLSLPGVDGTQLALRAADERISILPGEACAIDDRYRSFIRLSCGSAFEPRFDRAISLLARLARSCRVAD